MNWDSIELHSDRMFTSQKTVKRVTVNLFFFFFWYHNPTKNTLGKIINISIVRVQKHMSQDVVRKHEHSKYWQRLLLLHRLLDLLQPADKLLSLPVSGASVQHPHDGLLWRRGRTDGRTFTTENNFFWIYCYCSPPKGEDEQPCFFQCLCVSFSKISPDTLNTFSWNFQEIITGCISTTDKKLWSTQFKMATITNKP